MKPTLRYIAFNLAIIVTGIFINSPAQAHRIQIFQTFNGGGFYETNTRRKFVPIWYNYIFVIWISYFFQKFIFTL